MSQLDGKQIKDTSLGLNKINPATGQTLTLVGTSKIQQSQAPLVDDDLANKAYVDSIASGLDLKPSVNVATTTALPTYISSATAGVGHTLLAATFGVLPQIDSYTLSVNERILVKNQNGNGAHVDNGIYYVSNMGSTISYWELTRATDADGTPSGEVTTGMFTFVEFGLTNSSHGYVLVTTGTITLDTTPLQFTQFSDSAAIAAGAGLTANGNALDIQTTNGLSIVSDAVGLGGTLLQDTSIAVSTYTFSVAGRGNLLFDRRAGASESHILNLDGSISEFGWYSDIDTKNNGQVLIVTTTQSIFRDTQFSKGLQYDGDYTTNFTDNSLVTKQYVDNAVTGGGLTATNGLTETSPNVIALGGTLSQNTYLAGSSLDIAFGRDVLGFDNSRLNSFIITSGVGTSSTGDFTEIISDSTSISNRLQNDTSAYTVRNSINSSGYEAIISDTSTNEAGLNLFVNATPITANGSNNAIVISDGINGKGAIYSSDFSANFTPESLVSKRYVDNAVGLTSGTPVYSQRNLTPVITTGNGASSSLTLTSTPKDSTNISVYVNGSLQYLGNGVTTGDCYFGTQSGTAVAITSLISGYTLFWNGTNAGFDLSTTDRVDIVYNS